MILETYFKRCYVYKNIYEIFQNVNSSSPQPSLYPKVILRGKTKAENNYLSVFAIVSCRENDFFIRFMLLLLKLKGCATHEFFSSVFHISPGWLEMINECYRVIIA